MYNPPGGDNQHKAPLIFQFTSIFTLAHIQNLKTHFLEVTQSNWLSRCWRSVIMLVKNEITATKCRCFLNLKFLSHKLNLIRGGKKCYNNLFKHKPKTASESNMRQLCILLTFNYYLSIPSISNCKMSEMRYLTGNWKFSIILSVFLRRSWVLVPPSGSRGLVLRGK